MKDLSNKEQASLRGRILTAMINMLFVEEKIDMPKRQAMTKIVNQRYKLT